MRSGRGVTLLGRCPWGSLWQGLLPGGQPQACPTELRDQQGLRLV